LVDRPVNDIPQPAGSNHNDRKYIAEFGSRSTGPASEQA
jgi:hypothetical protein